MELSTLLQQLKVKNLNQNKIIIDNYSVASSFMQLNANYYNNVS
jgi:hypothetical protein